MKKFWLMFLLLNLLLIVTVCESSNDLPKYQNQVIDEQYLYDGTDISVVEFTASYPQFEGQRYEEFNRAIVEYEVCEWKELYLDIVENAKEEIEIDRDTLMFDRYVKVTYTVEQNDEDLAVTFEVEWIFGLSGVEPRYTKTYRLSSNGMMYSTMTVTERIY